MARGKAFGKLKVDAKPVTGSDGNDVLAASPLTESNRILGGDGNDLITGSAFADRINAGDGDDVVEGGAGDDILFGNDGFDTAVFSGSILDYSWEWTRGNTLNVSGTDGNDQLKHFEALQFDDFTLNIGGNNDPFAVLRSSLETDENSTPTGSFDINVDLYDFDGDVVSVSAVDITGGGSFSYSTGTASQQAAMGSSSGLTIQFSPGSAYDYLAVGETQVETVTLVLADGNGGSHEVTYDLTITGTNDAPVAQAISGQVQESATEVDLELSADVSARIPNAGYYYVFDLDAGTTTSVARDFGANYSMDQIAAQYLSGGNGLIAEINPNNTSWFARAHVFDNGTGSIVDPSAFSVVDLSGGTFGTSGEWLTFGDDNKFVDNISLALDDVAFSDGRVVDITLSVDDIDYEVLTTDDIRLGNVSFTARGSDTADQVTLTADFSDVDASDTHSFTVETTGTIGQVINNGDGTFTYSANGQFEHLAEGETTTDTFTYTVDDNNGGSDTQTATVTILGKNDAPIGQTLAASGDEDHNINGQLLAADADHDLADLVFSLENDASNGTVSVNPDGSFTYTPNADFNGADSFSYRVADPSGAYDIQSVDLSVSAVNDAPVVRSPSGILETDEDQQISVPGISVFDLDVNEGSGELTVTLSADNGAVELASLSGVNITGGANGSGSLTITGSVSNLNVALASLSYQPNNGFSGADALTIEVNDLGNTGSGGALTDFRTIEINVLEGNLPPVVSGPIDGGAISETDAPYDIDLLANATDPEGDALSVENIVITSSNGTRVVDFSINSGVITIDPAQFEDLMLNDSEDLTISYDISDGNGGLASTSASLTVNGFSTPPVAVNSSIILSTITESGPVSHYLGGYDPTGQDIEFALKSGSGPTNGTVVINTDGTFTYARGAGFLGTDQFEFTVTDTDGEMATGTVDILVDTNINSRLNGTDGNDILIGGNGFANMYGNDGDDLMRGGDGVDYMYGGNGNDQIFLEGSGRVGSGQAGDDILVGYNGYESLNGGDDNDTIDIMDYGDGRGGNGNDTLTAGRYGNLYGDAGNDTLTVGLGSNARGGDGNDLLVATGASTRLYGDNGDDEIRIGDHSSGTSYAYAGSGNDTVQGGSGRDIVYSGRGDDWISTGGQNDTVYLDYSNSRDYAHGGAGTDRLIAYAEDTGSRLEISGTGILVDGVRIAYDFENIEIFGRDGDDTLIGDNRSEVLRGYDGDDVIDLGGYGWAYGHDGNDHITGGAFNEHLFGQEGNDVLLGLAGNDQLHLGSGEDKAYGGDGNDAFHNDHVSAGDWLDGGAGSDYAYLYGDTGDNNIRLVGTDLYLGAVQIGENLEAASIYGRDGDDVLGGGNNRDWLYGEGGNDLVTGGGGNDYIYGHSGDDEIHGDAGNDQLHLGSGEDKAYGGDGNDAFHNDHVSTGDWLDGGAGSDYAYLYGDTGDNNIRLVGTDLYLGAVQIGQSIEAVTTRGRDGDDVIGGGNNRDWLYGEGGNDLVTGGGGNDYLYGQAGDDEIQGDAGNDQIHLGAGEDKAYGGDGNDTFHSDDVSAGDWIDGGVGSDYAFLYGDNGDNNIRLVGTDLYIGAVQIGENLEAASIWGRDGDDVIGGGNSRDWLYGEGGNDLITGGDGNDFLYGHAGNDEIHGDAGNDQIHLGAGEDKAYGGDDNDTFHNDDLSAGDWLDGGAGSDYAYLYGDTGNNNIRLVGTDLYLGAVQIGANLEAASIWGRDGDDVIGGGNNRDWLYGEGGNDLITGGDGNDFLYGHAGDDEIHGDAGNDNLYGSAGNDVLHGGDGNDSLLGHTGNDTINGDAGNDVIYGQQGNDLLSGGADADQFRFYSSESSASESDTITDFSVLEGDGLYLSGLTIANLSAVDFDNDTIVDDTLVELSNGAEIGLLDIIVLNSGDILW